MSDQTPPTDAPSPEGSPPVAPPVPPYPRPPAPPWSPSDSPAGPQRPAVSAPGSPYPAPGYPPSAQYPPAAQYPAAYPVTSPPGYATPGYATPAYAAPGATPTQAESKPGGLGLTALLLALAAAVIAPTVGAVAAFQVGAGTGPGFESMNSSTIQDLSFLSPVRDWVLLGEIAFWAGTILGIWAIVQGIVAIVKRRGLGTGIAAIVVAVVGIFVFGTVVYGAGIAGFATGAASAGIGA